MTQPDSKKLTIFFDPETKKLMGFVKPELRAITGIAGHMIMADNQKKLAEAQSNALEILNPEIVTKWIDYTLKTKMPEYTWAGTYVEWVPVNDRERSGYILSLPTPVNDDTVKEENSPIQELQDYARKRIDELKEENASLKHRIEKLEAGMAELIRVAESYAWYRNPLIRKDLDTIDHSKSLLRQEEAKAETE